MTEIGEGLRFGRLIDRKLEMFLMKPRRTVGVSHVNSRAGLNPSPMMTHRVRVMDVKASFKA